MRRTQASVDGAGLRDALTARHRHHMARWPRRADPYGAALAAGRDVAVSGWEIADALRHVGRDPGRFGDESADACRTFLLGGDDRLNVIEDRHVEDMPQEDFDELIAGRGRLGVNAEDDQESAVARYSAWIGQIRAKIG